MSTRISRDELFMTIAQAFAQRSTCERGHVGSVIVLDNHIIAHGYNGAPAGMPQCDEEGCQVHWTTSSQPLEVDGQIIEEPIELGCQRAIHAEANAVAYAAKVGVSCDGAVLYTTHEPCRKCAEIVVQAGVSMVIFEKHYRLGASDFLDRANVIVKQHVQDLHG